MSGYKCLKTFAAHTVCVRPTSLHSPNVQHGFGECTACVHRKCRNYNMHSLNVFNGSAVGDVSRIADKICLPGQVDNIIDEESNR